MLNIFKAILKTSAAIFVVAGFANSNAFADRSEAELTPNDDLIYAVKGIKNGVALMAGTLNPIVGLSIAAYRPGESSNDLHNIDEALAQGAVINFAEQHSGYTTLIYGAYHGYPDIVAHLLNKGASANIKEDGGYNAYTMAKYYFNWYTKLMTQNEKEEKDCEIRIQMHSRYQDLVSRYQKIVDILAPVTHDKQMPSSWWN